MHAISSSHFPDLHIIKRVTSTDADYNNPEMVKGGTETYGSSSAINQIRIVSVR